MKGYVTLLLLALIVAGFVMSGGFILSGDSFLDGAETDAEGNVINGYILIEPEEGSSSEPFESLQMSSSFCTLSGFDIILVLDHSISIDPGELAQMKSGMTSFVRALSGTSSQVAVVGFARTARVILPFTEDIDAAVNAINSLYTSEATNWEDALVKAQSLLPGSPNPDLIIFASDGDPNTIGPYGSVVLPGGVGDVRLALLPAVAVADEIKSTEARIVALGIGNQVNVENMKAISGPVVGNDLNADVIISDFNTLAVDLASIANTCIKDE